MTAIPGPLAAYDHTYLKIGGVLVNAADGTVRASDEQDVGGGRYIELESFDNQGTLEISSPWLEIRQTGQSINTGPISIVGGDLYLGGGGLINQLSGVIDIRRDGIVGSSSGPLLINEGLLRKSAGDGTTELQMALVNSGLVKVETGLLRLGFGYAKSGSGQVDTGGSGGGSGSSGDVSYGDFTNSGQLNLGTVHETLVTTKYGQTSQGSLLEVIGGYVPGIEYGQIEATGGVSLAGLLNVTFANGFRSRYGDTFTVIRNRATVPVIGAFANMADGSTVIVEGRALKIDYTGGPLELDVTLTDVTPIAGIEGRPIEGVMLATWTVADPNAQASEFAAAVDWGGAVVGLPTVTVELVSRSDSVSEWKAVATVAYADAGSYNATISVTRAGIEVYSTAAGLSIDDALLSNVSQPLTYSAQRGQAQSPVVLATFLDGNPWAVTADYTFTSLNWGTGDVTDTSLAVQLVSRSETGSVWQVVGTATYLRLGTFTVSLTIHDEDGADIVNSSTQFVVSGEPPSSQVAALPQTTTATGADTSIPLTWTGDALAARYTISVSDNGGAFVPFILDTTETTGVFTGAQVGHTYRFYSVASDVYGATEIPPQVADAQTIIVSSLSIQSIAPVTPSSRTSAVSSVNVTFSSPLDLNTFTAADLSLTVDGGANLLAGPTLPFPITFALVAGTTSTYRINGLTNYTGVNGAYQLTVNAGGIQDASGNTGDGSASTDWVLNAIVPKIAYITRVSPNARETAVDTIDVTFSKALNLATFTTADLTLKLNSVVVPFAGTETVSFVEGTTYRISGLAGVTGAEGSYSLTVNAAGVQDAGGAIGSGTAATTWSLKLVPPKVTRISPVSPNPTNIAVDTFDVTFSEEINPSTFDLADLTLQRSKVVVPLTGTETLTYLSGNTWRIGGLAGLTNINGAYSLTVSTVGIQDANGVSGTTSRAVTWTEDFTAPTISSITAVTPNPGRTPIDAVKFTLSEKVQAGTLTLANLSLTRNGGVNLLTGAETLTLVSGNTWQLGGLAGLTAEDGSYALKVDATDLVDLAGNAGIGSKSITWTMDTLAPTSSIAPFATQTATSLSLVLLITGNDPVPANGAVHSGLKNYDIYVATDGGAFVLWKTVTASSTSATTKVTFAAQSDHTYAFHSVALDKAGNVEAKALDAVEASIAVPDLSPPATQVTAVDSSQSTFVISMQGADVGSNGVVASFDLYVSIDGAAAKRIATVSGGPPDAMGVYRAQVQFRAIADNAQHTYRFYSIGKDGTRKTEAAPAVPADVSVSAAFPPIS